MGAGGWEADDVIRKSPVDQEDRGEADEGDVKTVAVLRRISYW